MCHCSSSTQFGQVNVTCVAPFPKPKSWVMGFLSIPFSTLEQWVLLLTEKDRTKPQTTCWSLRNWDRGRWRNRERGAPVQRISPIPHAWQCPEGTAIRSDSEINTLRTTELSRVCSCKNKQEVHLCLVIKNSRTRRQVWECSKSEVCILGYSWVPYLLKIMSSLIITPSCFLQNFLQRYIIPHKIYPAYADKCGLKKHRKIFTSDDGRLYLAWRKRVYMPFEYLPWLSTNFHWQISFFSIVLFLCTTTVVFLCTILHNYLACYCNVLYYCLF